jgi:hypothetical protein
MVQQKELIVNRPLVLTHASMQLSMVSLPVTMIVLQTVCVIQARLDLTAYVLHVRMDLSFLMLVSLTASSVLQVHTRHRLGVPCALCVYQIRMVPLSEPPRKHRHAPISVREEA